MSAKLKMKVRSVKSTRKSIKRARVSSNCCKHREDPAVESVQDAGKVLSDLFRKLENQDVAEKLVRAIRCHDAKTIQHILDCECRVLNFFCDRDKDCVRICCAFGRYNDVTVTFDICIKRVEDACQPRRNNFFF